MSGQLSSLQGSDISFPDLSQGKLNHILGLVGMESDGISGNGGGEVLGRAVQDIRVCASPGRDQDTDHGKKRRSSSKQEEMISSPEQVNGRKRANPAQVEVTKCTIPPKRVCHGLSREKVFYTIETYPEVIMFK